MPHSQSLADDFEANATNENGGVTPNHASVVMIVFRARHRCVSLKPCRFTCTAHQALHGNRCIFVHHYMMKPAVVPTEHPLTGDNRSRRTSDADAYHLGVICIGDLGSHESLNVSFK